VTTSPLFSNKKALSAVRIDKAGQLTHVQLNKASLATELSLPLRDFRIVDPSLPSQIQATFKSRPHVLLFSIENIKVVVKHDELFIFSPDQAMVQAFIPALQRQIATLESAEGELSNNEDDEGSVRRDTRARFEHVVLETALNVVCRDLARRVRALSPAVSTVLEGMRSQSKGLEVVQTQVDELLPLKNQLDDLKKRVKELKRAVVALYDSDEDMANMYLGPANLPSNAIQAQAQAQVQAQVQVQLQVQVEEDGDAVGSTRAEVAAAPLDEGDQETVEMNLEMLLENYVNEIEWISTEVEDLMDEIMNSEENLVLQLDIIRNRMLRFELLLSMSSFVVGTGALVTGAFGMNLLSHLESHKGMLWKVSGGLVGIMTGMTIGGVTYGRRKNLL
jgi:magnesium transporter